MSEIEGRYDPTTEDALAVFMRLGCPEGREAYCEMPSDAVVFRCTNEAICVGDIRRLQAYLRASGFTGGRTRLDELVEMIPTSGGIQ